MDLFEKLLTRMGPLGQHAKAAEGYYMFPKLEGEISSKMIFRGKERLVWSLNNYLGLANHPEVREADAAATADFGMAYPMGARMMSGNSNYHEQLEKELASFIQKPKVLLVNYGYQGMVSAIDALVDDTMLLYTMPNRMLVSLTAYVYMQANALCSSTTM